MALPTISGIWRAGTDAELRYSPSGTAVANFRAVASASKKDPATGEWVDNGEIWVSVTCFKSLAEFVAENVTSGERIAILGNIQVEQWTDREGGKRETIKVIADAVSLVPRRDDAPAQAAAAPAQEPAPSGDPWGAAPTDPNEPPF